VSTIAERVAAGAAFLDEHDPEWWRPDVERAIDLDALDLHDTGLCVLGQRCPLEVLSAHAGVDIDELGSFGFSDAYFAYAKHLSGLTEPDGVAGWALLEWACVRGFITSDSDTEDWADLTAEWTRVITERRAAS
jgi:hypothetical protein